MERKVLAVIICLAVLGVTGGADDSLAGKCSSEFPKVTQCLPFVTAKAATPSKDCCDSTKDLKDSNPACLCFIIQQIHNGSNAVVKSMGVQEGRLLQLSSACKLTNASVSECPRLLHLAPNSPDAAFFTNSNSSGGSSSTSSPTATGGSFRHNPQLAGFLSAVVALAIFFHVLPTGNVFSS